MGAGVMSELKWWGGKLLLSRASLVDDCLGLVAIYNLFEGFQRPFKAITPQRTLGLPGLKQQQQQHLGSISAWLAANFGTQNGLGAGLLTGSTGWMPLTPLATQSWSSGCLSVWFIMAAPPEPPRMFSLTRHVHSQPRMRVCTRK